MDSEADEIEPVSIYHSILTADAINHGASSKAQGQFSRLGTVQEHLHYGVCAWFHDLECYPQPRREAEVINDIRAALTTPGCSSLYNIEGIGDVSLTNWVSSEIAVYSGYDVEGRMLFQYENKAHVFMRFEITHVLTKAGGVHRNMRHGKRVA